MKWRNGPDIAGRETIRQRAACADEDPELFFPVGTSGPALLQTEAAKAICRQCPIRQECLEGAPEFGVWGGYSEGERIAMKRKGTLVTNQRSKDADHRDRSELVRAMGSVA